MLTFLCLRTLASQCFQICYILCSLAWEMLGFTQSRAEKKDINVYWAAFLSRDIYKLMEVFLTPMQVVWPTFQLSGTQRG